MVSEKDGIALLYVPAGEFTMGSDTGEAMRKPVRQVYLDAFWIDQTEVTNEMYAQCVEAGRCDQPFYSSSYTYSNYFDNPEFSNYPVVYVDWDRARTLLPLGRADALPTEAEWEKAATRRGRHAHISRGEMNLIVIKGTLMMKHNWTIMLCLVGWAVMAMPICSCWIHFHLAKAFMEL